MSSISAAGGHSTAMALAQVPARAGGLRRPDAAPALEEATARAELQLSKRQDAPPTVQGAEGAKPGVGKPVAAAIPQPFASTSSVLQARKVGASETDALPQPDSAELDKPSANEVLQDKMLRQVMKAKESYSHIQAHTGNSHADSTALRLTA